MEQELRRGRWEVRGDPFTAVEIEICGRGENVARSYAACFAAKEATLKALGLAVSDLGYLREVEVLLGRNRRHNIRLSARTLKEAQRLEIKRIWLSMAATKKYSIAMVVLEA
jgi:holo-[acyl-carrier protein] synthase